MPSARAVFLFLSSGYNAHISISPVKRRYTLFESLNVKLYYRQEKARRCVLRAFIAYAVICRRFIRPPKRCRRAHAAFRRLFIRPSGRGCLRLSLRLFRLSACRPVALFSVLRDLLHLVSGSGGGRAQSGRFRLCLFCPRPSVRALLSASLRLSRVVGRTVVKSKVVRES